MGHHFDAKFYKQQADIKDKATAESVSHKEKTWSSLKAEDKSRITFITAQKVGTVPEVMVYE